MKCWMMNMYYINGRETQELVKESNKKKPFVLWNKWTNMEMERICLGKHIYISFFKIVTCRRNMKNMQYFHSHSHVWTTLHWPFIWNSNKMQWSWRQQQRKIQPFPVGMNIFCLAPYVNIASSYCVDFSCFLFIYFKFSCLKIEGHKKIIYS